MLVDTVNRFARGLNYPNLVSNDSIALVTDVSSPGTDFQNASYSMNGLGAISQSLRKRAGLGSVITDITSGNFSSLPTDFINGLNPSTLDIGSYLILGAFALLLFGGHKGRGRSKSYSTRRKAALTGQIAQDQSLLKAS